METRIYFLTPCWFTKSKSPFNDHNQAPTTGSFFAQLFPNLSLLSALLQSVRLTSDLLRHLTWFLLQAHVIVAWDNEDFCPRSLLAVAYTCSSGQKSLAISVLSLKLCQCLSTCFLVSFRFPQAQMSWAVNMQLIAFAFTPWQCTLHSRVYFIGVL